MKKSPFSTPRGNGGWHSPGWLSGGSSGRGYGRPKSFEFYSPNRSQTSPSQGGGDDFIPFNNTTPSRQEKSSPNWQSPRGHRQNNGEGDGFLCFNNTTPSRHEKSSPNWQSPRGHWQNNGGGGRCARRQSASPGYQNYRENRGRNNHQQTPYYTDTGRQFHGPKKNFQGNHARRKPDISQYMNLRSFLEDPWMQLSKKLSNIVSADESNMDSSVDLNFGNPTSTQVTDLKLQPVATDSFMESDVSFLETSQEFVDSSVLSDSSTDLKLSQDSND